MRISAFFLLVVSTVILATTPGRASIQSLQNQKPIALILSFSALPKRKENSSEVLSQKIREHVPTDGPVEFHFCTLSALNNAELAAKVTDPGPSPQQAKECISNHLPRTPQWIIAMGETRIDHEHESEWVRFETIAYNLWQTPEQDGNPQALHEVGPDRVASTFHYQHLFCDADKSLRKKLKVSTQPGVFACNQIHYELLQEYSGIPVGFLHINLGLSEKSLEKLAQWIVSGISSLHNRSKSEEESTTVEALLAHAGYPLSRENQKRWIEIFKENKTLSDCEKDFVKQFSSLVY
jgi:hypothetical protein